MVFYFLVRYNRHIMAFTDIVLVVIVIKQNNTSR